jgi:hypothetical protein
MKSMDIENKLRDFRFAVVGVARNCQSSVKTDINRIRAAMRGAKSIAWAIVESDSTDGTLEELESIKSDIDGFSFNSLGKLQEKIPKRTERISLCRNNYVQQIRTSPLLSGIDFVVVADLDGINNRLNQAAFESCWRRDDWDMCSANQNGPYYDIWALRHKDWCPGDCWAQDRFLKNAGVEPRLSQWASVYSKMITIPETADWIEVDSAFGGFAVYRKRLFEKFYYQGITQAGNEVCEHVEFHRQIRSGGGKIFINPRLINADYTEHTAFLQPR